ncbi:hypothetical protein A1Q1_00421 [Trichosporon asahii var. asahii CBS 2479]|jgi:pimeloyl-ACP methyl ester carboxylesterase|uniref:AB hydrolase-1 domain-containing protein n=1 Tax=Trichosporon asahii var. asahii (strain ATCC 90039 / CBS 2479 / JCM 2466 / KCTC 7840 / NBRC 103889/ NCYC 2677 / UAMH 7654) TaxID=1186058 RepID=J5TCV4_TRIAS|nr:hypothetical protein A1Q1_00421 [Trichosporon asahii var. asahii CBS 2479]EJT50316.1 hypothetical protein A1Q1_00421 [Trichosporon asahii var. asahii CBS 2479]
MATTHAPPSGEDNISDPSAIAYISPNDEPTPTDKAGADARKANSQDPAHVMNFGNLSLGHPLASHQEVFLADLRVHVHGLAEIEGSTKPVAVVLLAHGWANKAAQMGAMASGLIGESRRPGATHDLLVVCLDQRNHGQRRVNPKCMPSYRDAMRPADMLTVVQGGVQDYTMVMDFLPSYLWPTDERTVDRWMVSGVSMGGHVMWRILRSDPRVRVGVPIISIPPERLGTLLTIASEREGLLGTKEKPHPRGVREGYAEPTAPGAYRGKKILCLYGSADAMVPYALGKNKLREIMQENRGDVQFWIQPDMGHVCSQEMVKKAADWFWEYGLAPEADAVWRGVPAAANL